MASLKKEVLPSGTTRWRARYTHAGRQHEKAFRLKGEGERWLAERTAAIATGSHAEPARGRVTVAEVAEEWIGGRMAIKPKTRAFYEQVLNDYVLPRWGKVRVAEVEHDEIEQWMGVLLKGTKTRKPLSASSVRHAHRVLSLVLAKAIKGKRIVTNPAADMDLPTLPDLEMRFLDRSELIALANAAGKDADMIQFLGNTGLRFGEVVGLRVKDLKAAKRQVHVFQNITEVEGRQVVGTPKGGKGRDVPVPSFLIEALQARAAGRQPDDPLFRAPRGGRVRIGNWRKRVFVPACQAAGLSGVRIHDLRHTAASLAISAGANVKVVQRMLGHASAAMTLDVYGGLFDKDLGDVADVMDAAHRALVEEAGE